MMVQSFSTPTRKRWTREIVTILVFVGLTAVMTWPWVAHLRNAVSDAGDPYMIAWTLWWDFHQTFHHPLHLFQANVFFPYQYTLAFSEHDYGIAIFCFPLFALGLRPLTVHSIATFSGFIFCGYSTFRLMRTLTNCVGAAWIAGIAFAFVPFRYHLLSHLHYLFAGWMPLLLESFVLFARQRTWRRASWLGVAFFMNGLTCITWLLLTVFPLAFSAVFLLIRYWDGKSKTWLRPLLPVAIACLLLAPFLWPYYKVSKLYNFKWPASEAIQNSAGLTEWLVVQPRVKVLRRIDQYLPTVAFPLFPGFVILILASLVLLKTRPSVTTELDHYNSNNEGEQKLVLVDTHRWTTSLRVVDALTLLSAVIAFAGLLLRHSSVGFFRGATRDRGLFFFCLFLTLRLFISYPTWLRRTENQNLIDTIKNSRGSDALWLGLIWAIVGFVNSLGTHVFLNRVISDLLFPYRSLRVPARAAMICYVGLAILAGLGALKITSRLRVRRWVGFAALAIALIFELHASPLGIIAGAVNPDNVTLRLKQTSMRGGIVDLPSVLPAPAYPLHLAMLRAADHEKPLINATSTFLSPETVRIDQLTTEPEISQELMDLFERIPASYIVVHRAKIPTEQQYAFHKFFLQAVSSGRLILVGTYDRTNDLYAVTKTEPAAQPDPTAQAHTSMTQPRLVPFDDTVNAAALDALTFRAEPFHKQSTSYLSPDNKTRLIVFAQDIDVAAPETAGEVTAQLTDNKGTTYDLIVENVVPLLQPAGLTQIVVRLPDSPLPHSEEWWISIRLFGVQSNQLKIRISDS